MKLVHAADLHVDSPLVGLSRYDGAPEERLRGATRRALARKWRVNFTPTINFFPEKSNGKQSGRDLEVMRMPGYFKPFHFLSMFEFVEQNAYKDQNFQRFLQAKFKALEAAGVRTVQSPADLGSAISEALGA